MLKRLLARLSGTSATVPVHAQRPRLHETTMPAAIYAIGDIHGCHRLFKLLENQIFEDAKSIDGEKWLVYLGDYIDRGPSSAAVIDHLMSPAPGGFRRICLAGNHEEIAFDFLNGGHHANGWLDFGGRETLASYGLYDLSGQAARAGRQIESHIPREHIEFLGGLASMLTVPGFCFVHAGIDPSIPLVDQSDATALWSRPGDFTWPVTGTGYRVVHGHTPVSDPDLSQPRINIDLGAYATGNLGAIRVLSNGEISVLRTG